MLESFAYDDGQDSPAKDEYLSDSTSYEDSRTSDYKVVLGHSTVYVTTTRDIEWLSNAVNQFERVAKLEEDWDSYGAAKVDQRTLEHAFQIYLILMSNRHVEPQIGATVNGGVSLEWHIRNSGLEIEVERPYQIHALFYNDDTGEEWEDDLKLEIEVLKNRLDEMGA